MHPYITERLADARTAELLAEAEKRRRAGAAAQAARLVRSTQSRKRTRLWPAFFQRRARRSDDQPSKIVGAKWHA